MTRSSPSPCPAQVISKRGILQVYMLPEGAASGSLRLYVAELFPLRWKLAKILIDRPLIDTAVVEHNGTWWMFTTG